MTSFFAFIIGVFLSLIPRSLATTPATSPVTLLATGDILTARSVNARMVKDNNFSWPYEYIRSELSAADVTLTNLETPLIADCPTRHDGMIFCGDLRNAQALADAGVDVVGIANNHAGNQGQDGVDQTVKALEAAGLTVIGVDQPKVLVRNGVKMAFLAYNDVDHQAGVASTDQDRMTRELEQARQQADTIVVSLHWGNEYTHTPTKRQRELATWFSEQGVDLIIGNHPHWTQPTEKVGETLVTFSNGNTIFDQMWSEETRLGQLAKYQLDQTGVTAYELLPLKIFDFGQPRMQ